MQPWNTVKVGSPSKCVCVSGAINWRKIPFTQVDHGVGCPTCGTKPKLTWTAM